MKNGSLWSNEVSEKEVIYHEFDFETSDLEFEVSKSSIWNQKTLCDNVFFYFNVLLSRNFDKRLSSNLHKFVILGRCWDTPSEKTGLWQLPIVPSVFKGGSDENVVQEEIRHIPKYCLNSVSAKLYYVQFSWVRNLTAITMNFRS